MMDPIFGHLVLDAEGNNAGAYRYVGDARNRLHQLTGSRKPKDGSVATIMSVTIERTGQHQPFGWVVMGQYAPTTVYAYIRGARYCKRPIELLASKHEIPIELSIQKVRVHLKRVGRLRDMEVA